MAAGNIDIENVAVKSFEAIVGGEASHVRSKNMRVTGNRHLIRGQENTFEVKGLDYRVPKDH